MAGQEEWSSRRSRAPVAKGSKRRRTEFGLSAWLRLCHRTSRSGTQTPRARRVLGLTLALVGVILTGASARARSRHPPIQAEVHARGRRTSGAARQVSRHRHPQPSRAPDAGTLGRDRQGDGRAAPAGAGESQRGHRCAPAERPSRSLPTVPRPIAWCSSRTSTSPTLDQPGYGARAAARLEADLKAGARGTEDLQELRLVGEARQWRSRHGGRSRVRPRVADLRATAACPC